MSTNKLSQEEVINKFENLVKFAAKQTTNNNTLDSSLDVQDLYQEGMMLLHKCWLKYNDKPIENFKAIFSTSLFRMMHNKANSNNIINIDISEAYDLGYTEDRVSDMYVNYGMEQLRELLKFDYVATAILNELIEPSSRTLWEMNMDNARKNTVSKQYKGSNAVQECKVKMLHIKRALELKQTEFDLGIARLRRIAKLVYSESFELAY